MRDFVVKCEAKRAPTGDLFRESRAEALRRQQSPSPLTLSQSSLAGEPEAPRAAAARLLVPSAADAKPSADSAANVEDPAYATIGESAAPLPPHHSHQHSDGSAQLRYSSSFNASSNTARSLLERRYGTLYTLYNHISQLIILHPFSTLINRLLSLTHTHTHITHTYTHTHTHTHTHSSTSIVKAGAGATYLSDS